jgi:hypothetical protein
MGFATDNITCAAEIDICLDEESIYIFSDTRMPDLAELDGTAGFVASTASLTTVPLPGSVVMLMSALGLLLNRARGINRAV